MDRLNKNGLDNKRQQPACHDGIDDEVTFDIISP